jgi:hypothetical protein
LALVPVSVRVAWACIKKQYCKCKYIATNKYVTVAAPQVKRIPNAMEGSLSTYGSIIPKYRAQWEKLNDNEALAQLHRKFWPQGEPSKSDSELLNIHDDEDADSEEGEDNEIGPGCYVLDLGIPGIRCSMLWIRKEYIRLYKCCNEFLEAHRNNQEPPSVVITGQPGIGKCHTF